MSGSISSAPGSTSPAPATARRRPIPRKGHTKSRAGCPNCKRRKVKCDEVIPECGPCRRLGLRCEYSRAGRDVVAVTTGTRPTRALPAPGSFSMADLRFFQHFLVCAYPPLPIGGWSVWQLVSQMSHEYDFLAHAMVGLGASHLSLLAPTGYVQDALQHRVVAIKRLNEFLARRQHSASDAVAAFAAILVLTYQAAHMPDGLYDFLTMTRGCFLMGPMIGEEFRSSVFQTFEREWYVERAVELVTPEAHHFHDRGLADGFCASLEQLGRLFQSVAEVEYLALMRRIASSVGGDLAESYRQHTFLYEKLGHLTADEYASFVNPGNHVSRLVIMHMLVLDCIMAGRVEGSDEKRRPVMATLHHYGSRNVMVCVWVGNIYANLPRELRQYAEWPARFARDLMSLFGADTGC
ncbi:C6 transcription factor [Thelonectria olida]|uniref:C6 transcription factor n=1 Tax=Thelonectria olida TaxID=1576542 RepID=A0A9P8VR75_9HYPO|nr:C6 transcription factor [Thelonectria olida]